MDGALHPVEIALLGPVEVRGGAGSAERRPKLTELIVYLAMHPEGALSRSWSTALWPDKRVPPQTVANRLSEARRVLGIASDGRPRLRRQGERHQLVEVTTDWRSFQELSQTAAPSSWRAALELVRGRPFEDLLQDQWTILEGFVSEIEQAVADCALRLGEYNLASADPEGAAWAANCALRANPFDERLHRLLMRAADASGNRAGVRTTLRHLALVLEIDGDPLKGVHPQTAALYRELVNS